MLHNAVVFATLFISTAAFAQSEAKETMKPASVGVPPTADLLKFNVYTYLAPQIAAVEVNNDAVLARAAQDKQEALQAQANVAVAELVTRGATPYVEIVPVNVAPYTPEPVEYFRPTESVCQAEAVVPACG